MSMRRVFGCMLVAFFLLAWTGVLNAQLNRGVIEGTVTDPQGAVVPDVDVTITALATKVSLPTKTNNAGYYQVTDLIPGTYRARFVAQGFSPLEMSAIQVLPGQVIRTDAQLKLGTAAQTVRVTAELARLQTAPTNLSTNVETRLIEDLPLAGRDLQQLVVLVPGVVTAGPPGSNFGFNSQYGTFPDPTFLLGSTVSVNGGQAGSNAWYLDGNLNLSGLSENIVVNPSQDAVSEFQAITNSLSAEYGRTGGGVFSVVLKSGTNALHGNIYEYLRNDATNARNPFTSIDSFGKLIKERQLRYNNFGGTLGGPIVLPHLYDGRNKSFFFFSWDSSILHLLGNKTFTVPTPLMRQGNFSEDVNEVTYGIWDPFTSIGPAKDGTFARSAFGTPVPGSPIGCTGTLAPDRSTAINPTSADCNFATTLPSGRLDPVAMFFMNSFPNPNYFDPLSGCPPAAGGAVKVCSNFLGAVGSGQTMHNISLKIDHTWSEKSRWFGEWLFNPGSIKNYRVPYTGPTFPQSGVGWGSVYPVDLANQIIAVGNTYTVSPTLLNEFRVSFSRQFSTTHPDLAGYPDSVNRLSEVRQVLAPSHIPLRTGEPAPEWFINTPGGGFIDFGPAGWVNAAHASEAYTILDNVTKIVGKHTLKTGFVYRLNHLGASQSPPTDLFFAGGGVNNPVTGLGGSGLAQFMLGAVTNDNNHTSLIGQAWDPYLRYRYWGAYLQDDWRITPRLTLNVGLRYEIFGSWSARQKPISSFCFTCLNPDTGLAGKVTYEGDAGFSGHDIVPPNWNSVGPRLNFSWAPFADRKTVVRGGYDVMYSNAYSALNSDQMIFNANAYTFDNYWTSSANPSQCANFSGKCVSWRLSDTTTDKGSLTIPPVTYVFPAQQHSQIYGLGVNFPYKPSHDPMVETWGVEIQRQLPGDLALSVGYVGMHGTHLPGSAFYNWSHVPTKDNLQYRNGLYATAPITDFYSGKAAAKLAEIWGSSSLPRNLLLDPWPFWAWVNSSAVFFGTSIYHGLNVRVQKRYSQGLSFIAAYTAAKKINSPLTGQNFFSVIDPIHFARPGWIGGRSGSFATGVFGSAAQDPDNVNGDRAIATDDISQLLNVAATYELPFGSGRRFYNRKGPLNHAIGDWLLTANFNGQKGVPLSISGPCNGLTCRPNLIGDPSFSGSRSKQARIAQWINPAGFEPVFGSDKSFWASPNVNDDRWWRFGTAGLNLPGIRSPGFWNVDTSLAKRFHISEEKFFEFRWEMFNALNHQNLGFPNTGFCLPPGPNGETDLVRQAGCTFGRITNIQTDPRSMEFALKFYW